MNKPHKGWSDHDIGPLYDLAVIIGRFQPFHNGHLALINQARKIAKHTLILIGSSRIARNIKNLFTYDERVKMIGAALGSKPEDFNFLDNESTPRTIMFGSLVDDLYSDQEWLATVQHEVNKALIGRHLPDGKVVLVGHHKDDSSYYLDMFPTFDMYEVPNTETLHSTVIRDILFGQGHIPADAMPDGVVDFLKQWRIHNYATYQNLREEHDFIRDYKLRWLNAPFAPVFSTTDAVVICQGHILMIKRRMAPGKGLWALPGGFLGINESIEESMLRELDEETRIKIPKEIVRASIKGSHVFDHPERSLRGRTITHAFLIVLNNTTGLPKVRGSDDAERAKWIPISKFYSMSDQMYEDHYSIASYMINSAG